jgi:NCAIR mutase (PurE)-related protein
MSETELRELLRAVKRGAVSETDALHQLATGPFRATPLDFASPDHHRRLRHGLAEVIFGQGKTAEQIAGIARQVSHGNVPVLITRIDDDKAARLLEDFPGARHNAAARTLTLHAPTAVDLADAKDASATPHVAIVAAGTSDLPVAEEALEVCIAMGVPFTRLYDVGVAGLHRILARTAALHAASVLIVVAGMEGALPSVVGGLVGKPLIAVPTSVGYGASFQGLAALLAMLNSCAPGVTVVNIDNGFGAGFAAAQIVRAVRRFSSPQDESNSVSR